MLHVGLVALLVAVAAWTGRSRGRQRRAADVLLVSFALLAAAVETGVGVREASLGRHWENLARAELTGRARRIVAFLGKEGSDALAGIREVGADHDTQVLLSLDRLGSPGAGGEPGSSAMSDSSGRKGPVEVRRPVFLDLSERCSRSRMAGITVYDLRAEPRAWAGWSPTATTSLSREPRRDADVVEIRKGNIYTLLQVTHPVVGLEPAPGRPDARTGEGPPVVGYVVYQEPLRVRFPLENDLLRVDDVLRRLEGGGGARADVALELSLGSGNDLPSIRPGPLKLTEQEGLAAATASIVTGSGVPVGRVSLSGLSRRITVEEKLATARRVRACLLLVVGLLGAARLWFLAGERGAITLGARLALAAGLRLGFFHAWPRESLDPFGLFDPSWYASIRYGGLLRSPGDLLLTAAALLLAGREVRRFVIARAPSMRAFGRRTGFALAPGAFAALLVGSVAGLHWSRITDVARNANVPLYAGLDPFTSVPVAALELALLFAGLAFLLFGDALVTIGGALLARLPMRLAAVLVWGLALFGAAVKVDSLGGAEFAEDFGRVAGAIAALLVFHRVASRWRRPGAGALLLASVLAAVPNFGPLLKGFEARRRELVEFYALQHSESPSNSRHFLVEHTLGSLARSEDLKEALDAGSSPERENLAFLLWAKSPLASSDAGCRLRVTGPDGRVFSTFSLGFPPEVEEPFLHLPVSPSGRTRFQREEIGSTRIDVYSGRLPVMRGGRRAGTIELSMAYVDDLRGRPEASAAMTRIFTNLASPSDDFLRLAREVPDRVDRYRGNVLVFSTDPEGGLGKKVSSITARALEALGQQGRWVEREYDEQYDVFCVRERDGDRTVGYLTFGIKRPGLLGTGWHLVRSVLVTLLLAGASILFLMAFSWMVPDGPKRLRLPRIGFRERVIGGFVVVSLLPTLLLGFAGRRLIVEEKREEFRGRLQEDLRMSLEMIGRRLSDVTRNAAGSDDVRACLRDPTGRCSLSVPAAADGIVVISAEGKPLGAARAADLAFAPEPVSAPWTGAPQEYFRLRGYSLFACSRVPVPADPTEGIPGGGSVLVVRRLDSTLTADLERGHGSTVSFFARGRLAVTSRPELYQSEILSRLVDPDAYVKIELEGARRTLRETSVGSASFLASYAPLPDENGRPVGILATLATFPGGLDLEAAGVLSWIYFLCLLVVLVAIGAAVLLANRLTRPISELTEGAERIGAGQLGHRIRSKTTGEIGRLIRSFNLMSGRLAESEARDRARREYIEAIIRHVGSGVISFDASGRVATVNEAAGRILDVDPKRLAGCRPAEAGGSAVLAALVEAVGPLLARERADVVDEIEVAGTGDDEPRSVRLVGTPLVDREGNLQGAVIVFEDLTDLIRSKKIKAWAEMARQVAHEIKNPLTPMKLSAQHLRQAWRDRHPRFGEILEESTETIVDRCEALRRIAIEFSDYARMPGRKVRREDLGRLLEEARRLYVESVENKVDFALDVPETELYTRVDKDEVMRLFINLIENSIQAMPGGGDLHVRAWQENGGAHVTIRDTGTGIPSGHLARIFEPSFSTKTGGAGLGLPICKAIMEDYGGSIAIASEAGQGTTVTLVFPAEGAPAS